MPAMWPRSQCRSGGVVAALLRLIATLRIVAKSLFDPSKAAGARTPPDPSGTEARPLTVSQASDLIRHALERHTPGTLHVVGQMSNLSTREHWYFSLKDDKAVLPCVV